MTDNPTHIANIVLGVNLQDDSDHIQKMKIMTNLLEYTKVLLDDHKDVYKLITTTCEEYKPDYKTLQDIDDFISNLRKQKVKNSLKVIGNEKKN